MNIRALTIAAFVSVLILAGCPAPFSQSGTSGPAPGPVPMATWVAQGIPSDLDIAYSYSRGYKLGGEAIRITANGSATYTDYGAYGEQGKRFAGKLSPEALRRVILAFQDKRFFYLTLAGGCLVDIASPPTFSKDSPREYVTEAPNRTVSIHINGISWEVRRDEGHRGCDAISNKGDANFMSLVGILRGAVANLPPLTPTNAPATSTVIPTQAPAPCDPPEFDFEGLVDDAAIGYVRSHYPQLNIPSDNWGLYWWRVTWKNTDPPIHVVVSNERLGFKWEGEVYGQRGFMDYSVCRGTSDSVDDVKEIFVVLPSPATLTPTAK